MPEQEERNGYVNVIVERDGSFNIDTNLSRLGVLQILGFAISATAGSEIDERIKDLEEASGELEELKRETEEE